MKNGLVVVGVLAVLGMSGLAWSAEEEESLKQKGASIDSVTSASAGEGSAAEKRGSEQERAALLATQFHVSEAVVFDLRNNKKMGWGEITISLAMAQRLSTTSKEPLTTETALTQVLALRTEQHMGWGKIAQYYGFKLGPVVSAVSRSETSFRTAEARHPERRATVVPRAKVKVDTRTKVDTGRPIRPNVRD